jgi:hypothetical protein
MQPLQKRRFALWLLLCATALGGLTPLAWAQRSAHNELQQWDTVVLTVPVADKFRVQLEGQARLGFNSEINTINRLIIRPSVGYQITPKLSMWQGYAWSPSWNEKGELRDEHSIWEQLLYDTKWHRVDIRLRTRLEQRLIEHTAGQVGNRVRQMVRLSHPLGHTKAYVVGYNELFVNLNGVHNGPRGGYEQNRMFVGLGYAFNKHVALEGGYLLNHVRHPGRHDHLNHVLLFVLNIK